MKKLTTIAAGLLPAIAQASAGLHTAADYSGGSDNPLGLLIVIGGGAFLWWLSRR